MMPVIVRGKSGSSAQNSFIESAIGLDLGRQAAVNVSVAAIDATEASKIPHRLATINTRSRYAKPIVVALTGSKR